jgi:2-haloacid dehalogenase
MLNEINLDAILFDLGGVLIDWNPRYLYRPLFGGDDAALEQFIATVVAPEWNRQMDAGKPFDDAIAERQREFPAHAELIALWKTGWPSMLGDAIAETVEVLDALRGSGLRLYALTNWSAETFPLARARFPFLGWFQDIVVSGEVKLAKPDPRIFELAIERCGLTPRSTVFIDDHAPNIRTAQALGLHALRFEHPRGLRDDLRRLGLLP